MPLPVAVEKLLQDLDKKLHEENEVARVLTQIETKTGVKRLHLVLGLIGIHALYLAFGCSAELLCNVIGFIYPAYMSMKAIESSRKDDDTQWLTYWVVFALLSIVEFFSEAFVMYIPIYWLLKCAFLIWLYSPTTLGAQKIYHRAIQPFVRKHQTAIDKQFSRAAQKLNNGIDAVRQEFETHVKPN